MANPDKKPVLLPMLLLLGSFTFVFLLGEAVHELGHFLAHRAHGVDVGIRLDPFGGSRILHGSKAPAEIWGITSLAGPLFNLLVGITVSLILWRKRNPWLLPLVLWGPVALVQEGVTFSLGMLTPGGDAQLIIDWGVPAVVLLSLGILFLFLGITWIGELQPHRCSTCRAGPFSVAPGNLLLYPFQVVIQGGVYREPPRSAGKSWPWFGKVLTNVIPAVVEVIRFATNYFLHEGLKGTLHARRYAEKQDSIHTTSTLNVGRNPMPRHVGGLPACCNCAEFSHTSNDCNR